MAISAPAATQRGAPRDHGFHPLRVARVVHETAEAASFVLDVPDDLRDAFAYEAGQFLTFRVRVDGESHLRCYSMSSSPAVDTELQVTVKRVPGGVVSNWMIDTLVPGRVVEATCPAGVFVLPPDAGGGSGPGRGDIVAFGAGSGITPLYSLLKHALATTERPVRLLYANRDRDAVIFDAELEALSGRHAGRLDVVHHLDVERGFVDPEALRPFVEAAAPAGADVYVCGPAPFMEIVEGALLAHGVHPARINVERFSPQDDGPAASDDDGQAAAQHAASAPTQVTISLGGRTATVDHHPGTTLLQTARQMGLAPPYSCESGSCATCMAQLVEGDVRMHVNNALTDDEVADGWVLTCQSVPTSPTVRVVYEEG
jgi:3-ketosteroid 9alpha-monooxygenase subunit B